MYSILLNETKHFTGSYASVGHVEGGTYIETLPPTDDMAKSLWYVYDYHDIEITQQTIAMKDEPVFEEDGVTPKLDENGQQVITRVPILDDDGRYTYIETPVTMNVLGWYLDEEGYNSWAAEQSLLMVKETQDKKCDEVNKACQDTIFKGLDITVSSGTKHFSFTLEDQSNIKALYDKVKYEGATAVPYHADGEVCSLFTGDDIILLYSKIESFKMYNLTLCGYIKQYVRTLVDETVISSITFSTESLPADKLEQFNAFITAINQ